MPSSDNQDQDWQSDDDQSFKINPWRQSPSQWSFNGDARYLNDKHISTLNFPILNILTTHKFNPAKKQEIDNIENSENLQPILLNIDITNNINDNTEPIQVIQSQTYNNPINQHASNPKHLISGVILLSISGFLYSFFLINAHYALRIGFSIPEIIMYKGLIEIILCVIVAILTVFIIKNKNKENNNNGIRRNASYVSLLLPFSMEYNLSFKNLLFNKKRIINYGSISDIKRNKMHKNDQTSNNNRKIMISILLFGLVQFTSTMCYLYGTTVYDSSISAIICSLSICLAFMWSYFIFSSKISFSIILYVFLAFIGFGIIGYSSIVNYNFVTIFVIILVLLSTFADSFAYVLIKFASNIPTFIFVFSEGAFCGIIGLFLKINNKWYKPDSIDDIICILSLGLIGFCFCWCYIRGTQLVSIGLASYLKMTNYILFCIIVQTPLITGILPSFYDFLGIVLILLSIVLMLIEKFSAIGKHNEY